MQVFTVLVEEHRALGHEPVHPASSTAVVVAGQNLEAWRGGVFGDVLVVLGEAWVHRDEEVHRFSSAVVDDPVGSVADRELQQGVGVAVDAAIVRVQDRAAVPVCEWVSTLTGSMSQISSRRAESSPRTGEPKSRLSRTKLPLDDTCQKKNGAGTIPLG
ncbi:hypothetical protein [Streptomyces sp. NPDC047434]|uniref:hypothetical protein n=1 Tax=Streptomyces sp. NPDC047434 TaxID=3155143 RepID=UPI0033DD8FAC